MWKHHCGSGEGEHRRRGNYIYMVECQGNSKEAKKWSNNTNFGGHGPGSSDLRVGFDPEF